MGILLRKRDGLRKTGFIEFVEFDEDNRGKEVHVKPEVGFSCVVNRGIFTFGWLTSVITEVISDTEFRTKNSHYTIEI